MSRLVIGLQPVREAIRVHGVKLESVIVEENGGPQIEAVARFATDRGAKVVIVRRAELDRTAQGARHQGAIAYAPDLALVELEDLIANLVDCPVIVALDEIEDPQNFGAVIRSAVALGAGAIVWPEHHSAPLSPATFRASAGAVEHAPCRASARLRIGDRAAPRRCPLDRSRRECRETHRGHPGRRPTPPGCRRGRQRAPKTHQTGL